MMKLTLEQGKARLDACPQWRLTSERGGALHRTFTFCNFVQAFEFMTQMAQWSEAEQHHPEWFNVYGKVDILLTTHDADGLSEKDFAWACQADRVALSVAGDSVR